MMNGEVAQTEDVHAEDRVMMSNRLGPMLTYTKFGLSLNLSDEEKRRNDAGN